MERLRNFSERSFSSAESWELVKIEDHEKESFPFEKLQNSSDSNHSSVGYKCSTGTSLVSFSFGAEFATTNGSSVDHSIGSSELNGNGSSAASSTDGSSVEGNVPNPVLLAQTHVPMAPIQFPNCPFPNFAENESRAEGDDGFKESRVVHWLGLQRRQVVDSSNDIVTNAPNVASPNRGEVVTNNRTTSNKHALTTDSPVGLMAVLFSAMAISAFLSVIEHFAWPGLHLLSSNYSAVGEAGQKMAMEMDADQMLHGYYANCKSQLENYKIAYVASVDAVKQLQSEKAEHKKTIRKLRAEVAKLKIAVRSAAANRSAAVGEQPPVLIPPACTARESGDGGVSAWQLKRANARTEYRWRRLRDNYSTTPAGTFGTKFSKWLFERAELRQKKRESHSSKQNYNDGPTHYYNGNDGVGQRKDASGDGTWFEQRHKIRAKLREFCNNFEHGKERLKVPTWEKVKEKLKQFGDDWL